MKKILILLIFCLPLLGEAQTQKERVDKLVSREQVSTGVLYNRVMPWAGLHIFGQKDRKDTSSLKHFKQSIYEMEVASNQKGDATYSFILKNWTYHQNKQNIMPIGVLNHVFEYSPDLAIENLQDSTFVDPKLLKINKLTTFVVAPLSENFLYVGKPIQVELRESLIFDNTSEKLVSLQADFGEGKSYTFQKGQTFTLTYTSAGIKTVRFVGKFSNGTEKITFAKIEVQENTTNRVNSVSPCILLSGVNTIKSTIPFTAYEPEPFPNAPAEVEIGYYYANGKGCSGPTTKPILILDGFDPQDKRKIINNPNYPDADVIYDKLNYKDNSNSDKNLGQELRAQGYDVIVANFPKYYLGMGPMTITNGLINITVIVPFYRDGGADYIERNAMGIIAVINNINIHLQAFGITEQITIVGPSMGGLISRYALAYMEKNGMNHNTKLWVSLDSPHNGANISIGLQNFLKYFGTELGEKGAKDALDEQLNSAAARQQLLDHHNSVVSQNHVAAPDAFRAIFVNNLTTNGLPNSGGFPTQLRKVAIANGSQNGILSGYAGEHVFQVRGYLRVFWSWDIAKVAEGNIRLGGSYGTVTNSFNAYKHGKSHYVNSTINNSTSLDFSPGGTYEMFGEIKGQTPAGLALIDPLILGIPLYYLGGLSNVEVDAYKTEGCFIPTKSALAYKGTNPNWGEALNNRSLVCSGETWFDAYYAPNGANEGHIKLNNGNVTWVMQELKGIKNVNLPPLSFNVPIIAAHSGVFCYNGDYDSFSVSLPPNAGTITNITWRVDGNLTIGYGQGTTQVWVESTSDIGTGHLFVDITTTTSCLVGIGRGGKLIVTGAPIGTFYDIPDANGQFVTCLNQDPYMFFSGASHLVVNGQTFAFPPLGQSVQTSLCQLNGDGGVWFNRYNDFSVYAYNDCGRTQDFIFSVVPDILPEYYHQLPITDNNGWNYCASTLGNIGTYSIDANYLVYGDITWKVTSGLRILSGQGTSNVRVEVTSATGGELSFRIIGVNACVLNAVYTGNINIGFVNNYPPSIGTFPIFNYSCSVNPRPFSFNFSNVLTMVINGQSYAVPPVGTTISTNAGTLGHNFMILGAGATHTFYAVSPCGTTSETFNVTLTINYDPDCEYKIANNPKKSEISISPNPANTYVDVANILAGSEVKIYTKMGVLVLSEKSENDKIRLNISKLNTDLYILEAVLPNNVRVRKQIVKE